MRQLFTRVAAFVSWHRRAVGALLAALSVLAIAQWLSGPQGPTVPVVVAALEVPAGNSLTADDVRIEYVPRDVVPGGALDSPDEALGRMAAVTLAPGTLLQPALFTTARDAPEGRSIVPIRLPDPALRTLLGPGDPVTLIVIADEQAEVLTGDARVAGVPESAASTGLGISAEDDDLVLVEVPNGEAPVVAALGQSGQLSIVLGGA